MLLSHITFDDGLDLSPPTNEEFRYEIGEEFVYHWILSKEQPPVLFAAYNTRYIRELTFYNRQESTRSLSNVGQQTTNNYIGQDNLSSNISLSRTTNNSSQTGSNLANQEEPEETTSNNFELYNEMSDDIPDEDILSNSPQDAEIKTPLPRLIDICTCDPVPDPNCPICNHEHLHAHKD